MAGWPEQMVIYEARCLSPKIRMESFLFSSPIAEQMHSSLVELRVNRNSYPRKEVGRPCGRQTEWS